MENVNKQLIVAAKDILALHDNDVFVADPWNNSMETLRQAIAAAEQAQQAEPVARDVLKAFAGEVLEWRSKKNKWGAGAGEAFDAIIDRYSTQPPAVSVPDGVARAVEAVAAAIYFADSSDYLSTLWDALRFLSPEIATIAESDPRAAWGRAEQARAMLAAAPQATAEDSSVVQSDAPAPATEYSWSNNGEEYHGRFSSVAEAVCDYLDSEGDGAGEVVHIGEVKPHEPGNPIWLAGNVLETLGEQAHGDVGEYVGDWPELPPEKREQLGKMIQDFVWTHDAPRFFSIGKSELVEVATYRDAAAQKGGA